MKNIKPHGMSSEKASRVKKRGHRKEYIYASLIGGTVIKGTRKEDVMDSNGKIHSIKGGGEIKGGEGRKGKWQIFLYKISKFEKNTEFYNRDIFIKILKCYPTDYEEYQSKKSIIKERIVPYMKELRENLLDKTNRYNFFDKAFLDKRVHYFVIYQDEVFYIFDRSEVIKTFIDLLFVENSSTFQKVVFKHEDKIVAEIEVRTTNDGKYPSILFNMSSVKAFNLLTKGIPSFKELRPTLWVCGNAIDSFKL